MFENRLKSRIQNCQRSEQRLQFELTKINEKCPFGDFLKAEAFGQTVLPDRSGLIGVGGKCQNQKIQT